eukprot:g4228.t1
MDTSLTDADYKKHLQKPITREIDMNLEVASDVMEVISAAVDKYNKNWEGAAKSIKETLDKKYGSQWHCCIGQGYSYSISYNQKNMVNVYFGEQNLGVIVFRV